MSIRSPTISYSDLVVLAEGRLKTTGEILIMNFKEAILCY